MSSAAMAALEVTLIPTIYNAQIIHLGEVSEIEILARTTGGENYKWTLEGPGKFERTDPSDSVVVYLPPAPDELKKDSESVTIGVTVSGESGEKGEEKIVFTLIAPLPSSTPTAVPSKIGEIHVKDSDGAPLPPKYFVKPEQQITIELAEIIPSDRRVIVKADAVFGIPKEDENSKSVYTAPKGTVFPPDTVTIELVDEKSGETVMKKILDINFIIEEQNKPLSSHEEVK
jgi:hypothetical protein